MYISDLKKEFYEYLIGKNVVIIVHHDLDALCTCKILQLLLAHAHVQYTLIAVTGISDLRRAYTENSERIKYFILINCGATVDLIEELQPEDDRIFFVLDSHRPTDVCNIFSNDQVRLLWSNEEDQNVPEFDDLFQDDDREQEEEDDDDDDVENDLNDESEGRAAKRLRLDEQGILKRRDRRLWEERRNKLMFEYTQYSYYAKASAIALFELAHVLAKDNREILWLAIVALTSQQILGQIESAQYTVHISELQLEMDRLNRQQHNANSTNDTTLRIIAEQDVRLVLHRHWTVESTLMYSLCSVCKLKLWSRKGERTLQELLADMGLPLAQSKQKFCAMDLVYRQEFQKSLEKYGEKYGLDDITYPSFVVQYNYRNKFSAADIVYVVLALLERVSHTSAPDLCFGDALDCLSKSAPPNLMTLGLQRSKLLYETCLKILRAAIDQRKIFSAGPFLYFILHESFPDWQQCSRPFALLTLARYIQEGYCERHRSRNSATMPMLVSSPCETDQNIDPTKSNNSSSMCLLVGLPPLCENSPKNFFGKAFEQAAEKSNATVHVDYFDTSFIRLLTSDRTKFLDSLTALLS